MCNLRTTAADVTPHQKMYAVHSARGYEKSCIIFLWQTRSPARELIIKTYIRSESIFHSLLLMHRRSISICVADIFVQEHLQFFRRQTDFRRQLFDFYQGEKFN